jgi:energy-coupling factor transporter ATP-binding protein EcfA2
MGLTRIALLSLDYNRSVEQAGRQAATELRKSHTDSSSKLSVDRSLLSPRCHPDQGIGAMEDTVKFLGVYGLHRRLSFDLEFFDDISILYGRNGSGKTTVLHILANILNRSWDRFAFLDFDRIDVELSDGLKLAITRRPIGDRLEDAVEFLVNGSQIIEFPEGVVRRSSEPEMAPSLDDMGLGSIAKYAPDFRKLNSAFPLVGAAYFPAFRSMIEAWRSLPRENGIASSLPGLGPLSPPSTYTQYLQAHGFLGFIPQDRSSLLTDSARRLFGEFVPTVTFPSTLEIEDELRTRIRSTRYEVKSRADSTFSTLYVNALVKIVETNRGSSQSPDRLLERIDDLINKLDETDIIRSESSERADQFRLVRQIVHLIRNQGDPEPVSTLLSVFADALAQQLTFQQNTYAPLNRYISSVNRFLEGKHLKIAIPNGSADPVVLVEFDDGGTGSLLVLSSGERQILSMVYAASNMEAAKVVLIDEPELSLHLDWQRRLLGEMKSQLGNRQIIFATHSPEIGADYDEKYLEVGLLREASAVA